MHDDMTVRMVRDCSRFVAAAGVLLMALLVGVATSPAAAQGVFTGEVWNWDEKAGTISLRQYDGQVVRLKVPRETLIGLRLHQVMTVRGEIAPPAEIERIQVPAPAMKAVPRGTPIQSEVTGTVGRVEADGVLSVDSSHGALRVWIATPVDRYRTGASVRVASVVQPMDLIPAGAGDDAARPPSVTPPPQPGDYAVVVGSVLTVEADGRTVIDSPRGPVTVWLPGKVPYRVGDTVEVHTSVSPSP